MRRGPLFAWVALVVVCPRPARAYAWMVRHGYTTCATCHVDPSGSGVLTPYGRAQGEILLQSRYSGKPEEEASPAANFLWNALRTPDWLLGGGEVRYLALRTKVGDGPTAGDLILMQGDLAAPQGGGCIEIDLPVAEFAQCNDQRVVDRHRAVPIQDDVHP